MVFDKVFAASGASLEWGITPSFDLLVENLKQSYHSFLGSSSFDERLTSLLWIVASVPWMEYMVFDRDKTVGGHNEWKNPQH